MERTPVCEWDKIKQKDSEFGLNSGLNVEIVTLTFQNHRLHLGPMLIGPLCHQTGGLCP
jgi:hypothetical protein